MLKVSSGEAKRMVSCQDVQLVQNLVERCIQLYMNQKEAMETLSLQAKTEPGFTELVWQKLEEENQEFFKAYHLLLMVKHQIMIFNKLLDRQVELMEKMCTVGVASLLPSDDIPSSILQTPSCYVSENTVLPLRLDGTYHQAVTSVMLGNGRQMEHASAHSSVNASVHTDTGSFNVFDSMLLTPETQEELNPNISAPVVQSESGYSNNSALMFGDGGNVHYTCPKLDEASYASYATAEPNQPLSLPNLGVDASSFCVLDQSPHNFSFPHQACGVYQSPDIPEFYSSLPFVATDASHSPSFLGSGM